MLLGLLGCQDEPILTSVRSLEQSGKAAFMCLAAPGTQPTAALPLLACTRRQTQTPYEFGLTDDGVTTVPHLYALVTQTTRGEVAVVDLTSIDDSVLDLNPQVPGANFVPVGAQPIDIVATEGGTAAFVGVAEPGREGIFALPADKLRHCVDCSPTAISGFPSCSLPSAPGAMMLMTDPAKSGESRATCGGEYGVVPKAGPHGDLSEEGEGRQKLVVAMPDLGGIAVFDAQRILDGGWKSEPMEAGAEPEVLEPGAFAPCVPELWLPLSVSVPPPASPVEPPQGLACVVPKKAEPAIVSSEAARPSAFAFAADRLYVADLNTPLIHVLSMESPCEPEVKTPLLATSADDPSRVVVTGKLGVTVRQTTDLKRYLYAVDADEGSVMVFDVTDDQGPRYPLQKQHPEWNPFQPIDRIRFGAPVRDVLMIDRDTPLTVPYTGEAPEGVRCDPDPSLTACNAETQSCDPETLYRTGSDFTGAGPLRLRGQFALLMLTTAQVVVIDIDDLDAKCRIPKDIFGTSGCEPVGYEGSAQTPVYLSGLEGSGEVSCNVVVPHTPRSSHFLISNDVAGDFEPGIQAYPLLYDRAGTLITGAQGQSVPVMRATIPAPNKHKLPDGTIADAVYNSTNGGENIDVDDPNDHLALSVGGVRKTIEPSTGAVYENKDEPKNTLVVNFEDPRVHTVEQQWFVTYEGPLPGFGSRVAALSDLSASEGGGTGIRMSDADSRYCQRGVQSRRALRDSAPVVVTDALVKLYMAQGLSEADAKAKASGQADAIEAASDVFSADVADRVQLTSSLPAQGDAYWNTVSACNYLDCKATFGTQDAPSLARDLLIDEAYEDRLVLLDPVGTTSTGNPVTGAQVRCCFPTEVSFLVRPKGQWTVVGGASGFMHHVIADPATGVCRDSCDPLVQRLKGRAFGAVPLPELNVEGPIPDGYPYLAFSNPLFRFSVLQDPAQPPDRDMQFRFVTQSSFAPLRIDLRASVNTQPTSMSFLQPFGEIAVTDGLLEGLYLVSLSSFAVRRQIY